ncbi:MAG: Mov34/MPN/PAD-1 family protein [Candidatus Sedimenticola sp. (ex Thyasira tokunagai)]
MFNVSNLEIGITVSITDECIEVFKNNRRNSKSNERGGLLFSSPVVSDCVEVSSVSEPTKKDKSGKYYFYPDPASSQQEIDRQFARQLAYVGDWHTHPSDIPKPSPKDVVTIKKVFNESSHNLNYVLMIIIGTSNDFRNNYYCLTDGDEVYELRVHNVVA